MSEKDLQDLMLESIYDSKEITKIWEENKNKKVINHPEKGWISPNEYRSLFNGKPCPYCGKKMVQGDSYYTSSKQRAIKKGYQYETKNSKGEIVEIINHASGIYYHPNYVSLDHKMNKARFPELLFEYDNLEVICWSCNKEKKDNNAFEIEHNLSYFNSLVKAVKDKYKPNE